MGSVYTQLSITERRRIERWRASLAAVGITVMLFIRGCSIDAVDSVFPDLCKSVFERFKNGWMPRRARKR